MGCTSSKILMRSASFKEEFQKRLQRGRADSYDEVLISTNRTEQFVAVLRSSMPSTVASKLQDHESSDQTATLEEESKGTLFAEKTVEEQQEPENKIETINIWDLLAGLEDDNEAEAEAEVKEEPFKRTNPINADTKTCQVSKATEKANESGGTKGLKRKIMAKDLAKMKVPAGFEFSRTGSLRDWLSQGGQVFSPGSYVTPKFGSFEPAAVNGGGDEKKEDYFDPNMVLQLEKAMEEMTMEEDKILRQIVNEL